MGRYFYNRLIIGDSLPAYLCSYINCIPLLYPSSETNIPFPWEFFSPELDFSRFEFLNQNTDLITNCGIRTRGMQKLLLRTRLAHTVALAGLAPFAGSIVRMEIDDEKKLIYLSMNDSQRSIMIGYNKLYVFNSSDLAWNLSPERKNCWYKVSDWFSVHLSKRHAFEAILNPEDDPFIHRIYYYLSPRVNGIDKLVRWFNYIHSSSRNSAKHLDYDFCAVSYLNSEQLSSLEYDENTARLKVIRVAKEAGVKGIYNHLDKNGERSYKRYEIEFRKREVRPLLQDFYRDKDDIRFVYWDDETMVRYALKFVNHTNTTDFLNKKIFGGISEILGSLKCPVQKNEHMHLTLRKCMINGGEQVDRLPAVIQKVVEGEKEKIKRDVCTH